MIKVKNIYGCNDNIEGYVNDFLKSCDKKGFFIRNITYCTSCPGSFSSVCINVFIEYEDGVKETNNPDRTKEN